jgi:hypothetical protein
MFSDFRRMIASLLIRAGQKLSLSGAKHLGFSENGNAILSLNKSSLERVAVSLILST